MLLPEQGRLSQVTVLRFDFHSAFARVYQLLMLHCYVSYCTTCCGLNTQCTSLVGLVCNCFCLTASWTVSARSRKPLTVGTVLSLSVPATINMYLRDYQRDGVRFLFRQYAQKQGGILGDDMVMFYWPLPLSHCSSPLLCCRSYLHCRLDLTCSLLFVLSCSI